jgi:uncharacterized protein (DUF885 family)
LAIRAERAAAEQQLGSRFDLAAFHDQVLGGGCVPLGLLSSNIKAWAAGRK